ncbi:MAG: hypothetical protein Q9174_002124 [Haloplaca sp. 1 TL-2023]
MLNIPALVLMLLLTSCTSAKWSWYEKRNYNTICRIYDRTVYPTNLQFITNGSASVPKGLFNDNATGRISPMGNFSMNHFLLNHGTKSLPVLAGFEDSTEYFFGLSPIPRPPVYNAFSDARVVSFSSGCPSVASSLVYYINSAFKPNSMDIARYLTTLQQVAFWEFDNQGQVIKYDAWNPSLRLYTTAATGVLGNVNQLSPERQAASIKSLCTTTQSLCSGNNTQYASMEDCVNTLSSKPFGDPDNFWADSVRCRQIHVLLARIRPVIHCPHLGPTGGGKCVDVDYNKAYFDDEDLFGEPIGSNFMCPL